MKLVVTIKKSGFGLPFEIMSVQNKLNEIRVAKLCININPGAVGDQVTRASRVIFQLTEQKAMLTGMQQMARDVANRN